MKSWDAASRYGKSRSMNQAFNECLRNRKIIVFFRARRLALKELTAANEDLAEARDRFGHQKYKYATINAYYAVFHAARALIYSRGYRERSHHCLGVAIEALFVDSGLLGRRHVKILTDTMALREDAEYVGASSKEGALAGITHAEEFIATAGNLIRPSK